MAKTFSHLFQPGNIGRLEVKNRIVKAPQWSVLAGRDGSATERLIDYYREIARGGTGLVIVEYAYIDKQASKAGACQLGVADNEHIPGLSSLARAIKSEGARAGLQLSHCGRQRFLGAQPIKAPSSVPWEQLYAQYGPPAMPQALTFDEIQQIIETFGDAARRTVMAGFDLVEVHAAHGYLLTNFLSPRTNKRTDWYGGSLENRMRLLVEVVRNVRGKIGPDFPLSIRLNGTEYEPDGLMLDDSLEIARTMEKLGADVIHVSGGNHHTLSYEIGPMSMPRGVHLWAVEAIKEAVGIPVVASGSINTPELAEETLAAGKADFISLARPLLADPFWPVKAMEGRPEDIRPCIRCNDGCQERGTRRFTPSLCTVNPALPKSGGWLRVGRSRKVAVIGGGPAGMEAALVCTMRGHDVTLFEKRSLGGALHEASVPEFKAELRRLIDYFATQVQKLGIKVVPQEATAGAIIDGGFDAAVVAVGAAPVTPDVPGIQSSSVTTALEVLRQKTHPAQKVVIVGGGTVGTEVGLFLAEQGKEIIFLEMLDTFMNGIGVTDRIVFQERLSKQRATVHTGTRLVAVTNDGVIAAGRHGRELAIEADGVVLAAGFAPQTTLLDQLNEARLDVYAAGDCVKPRKILEAIHEGHWAACLI